MSNSSSCNSMYSSESDCSDESSCYLTANSADSEPEFSPFDGTVEPLASPEEIAEYEENKTREEELENILLGRFQGRVVVSSW